MADNSKRKLALQALGLALGQISTLNGPPERDGYNTDVATVKRGIMPLDSISDSDLPAIFISRTVEKRENITRNQYKAMITVYLVGFVKSPDGVSNAQEAMDDFISDVTRALEEDRTLDGTCKGLEFKNVITDDGDLGARAGFVMEVELFYVTEGNHP